MRWICSLLDFDFCNINVLSHYIYTERKICLNLFGTRKFVLFLQPKRIFLRNKEKYIWFKDLLLYFKDPLLKSKDPVLLLKYDILNCKYFSSQAVKLMQIFSQSNVFNSNTIKDHQSNDFASKAKNDYVHVQDV